MNPSTLALFGVGYLLLRGSQTATSTTPVSRTAVPTSSGGLGGLLSSLLGGGSTAATKPASSSGAGKGGASAGSGGGGGATASTGGLNASTQLGLVESVASYSNDDNYADYASSIGTSGDSQLLAYTPVPTYDNPTMNYTPTPAPVDTISSDTSSLYLDDYGDFDDDDGGDW